MEIPQSLSNQLKFSASPLTESPCHGVRDPHSAFIFLVSEKVVFSGALFFSFPWPSPFFILLKINNISLRHHRCACPPFFFFVVGDLLTTATYSQTVMDGKGELIRIGRFNKIPAMMVIVLMFANSAAGIPLQKVLCLPEFVLVSFS